MYTLSEWPAFLSIMLAPLSEWTILLSGTLLFFLLGWIWYHPMTPTWKIWTSYFPMPKKMPPKGQMIIMMAFQLFMGFVIAHTVMVIWTILGRITLDDLSILNMWDCPLPTNDCSRLPMDVQVAMLSSLVKSLIITKIFMGFVFIKDLGHWFFEKKPFILVVLGTGYYLVWVLGFCVLLSYFL